jgi:hypothetical protein
VNVVLAGHGDAKIKREVRKIKEAMRVILLPLHHGTILLSEQFKVLVFSENI